MTNAPASPFAHFLGLPKKSASAARTSPQAATPPDRKLPPLTGPFAANVMSRVRMDRPSRKAHTAPPTAAKSAEPAPTRPKPASAPKRAKALSFDHLAPAAPSFDDTPESGSHAAASAIVAAAAKARTPAGGAIPTPTGLAAKVAAASAKARTPTGTGAAKPKGLAADILAAGRKRRGEV